MGPLPGTVGKEAWLPSPLLLAPPAGVLLYFQIEPDGTMTSPQVPAEPFHRLLRSGRVEAERVKKASQLLAQWDPAADRNRLLAALPAAPRAEEPTPVLNPSAQQRVDSRNRRAGSQPLGQVDYSMRNEAVQSAKQSFANAQIVIPPTAVSRETTMTPAAVAGAVMTPLWIDSRLVLARRVAAGSRDRIQGCILDWPAIKTSLLEAIADLLPNADLRPSVPEAGRDESRMLAALPVQLLPGSVVSSAVRGASPIVLWLALAWACVLTAALAVAALLWGLVRLSERRAAFVSAVTHELRSPLTTFRMYAEMLAEGMVPERAQQQHYVETLRREADRLTHLVENVLSYARLEKGRPLGPSEAVTIGDLVGRLHERLADRAKQAGMLLVVDDEPLCRETVVMANPGAVERVLFNLVDNACKYAAAAVDKRIHLELHRGCGEAVLAVRDHGPGVAASARRKLFRTFCKSAHEAAETAPGVGLGLVLSRRLARDMGGDLRLQRSDPEGACFVLVLRGAKA